MIGAVDQGRVVLLSYSTCPRLLILSTIQEIEVMKKRFGVDGSDICCFRGVILSLYNCSLTSMEVLTLNFAVLLPFCCAMLCKRGLSRRAVSVHQSVRVFVTFVHSVKTNKHIFIFYLRVATSI